MNITQSVGNHIVQVLMLENMSHAARGYRTLVDSPSFIIGGINGQAMTSADVVNSVARMFQASGATIYVNGDQSQQSDSPLELHVWLSPWKCSDEIWMAQEEAEETE